MYVFRDEDINLVESGAKYAQTQMNNHFDAKTASIDVQEDETDLGRSKLLFIFDKDEEYDWLYIDIFMAYVDGYIQGRKDCD